MASTATNSDINVECSEASPVVRNLSVEVQASRVSKAFDRAYSDLKRTARVKGFRPGKVPRSVLERMYGANMSGEIERALVSETLPAAIEQAEIEPVVEPDIAPDRLQDGEAFRYTARIEVKPQIELPEFSSLAARSPVVRVTDEDVDSELEGLREKNARLAEEEEGAEATDGHVVTIDFVGRVDGEVFPGGSGQGMDVEIGSSGMVPGFEEQLVGATAGEDRQVEVTLPDDYGPEPLRGKQAVFECHIVAVRRRELPELDDDFAKDLGDFETLDEMRERISSDLAQRRRVEAEGVLNKSLMDSLVGLSSFEVPPGMVERQLQSQMQSMHSQFQGKVPDEALQRQLSRMQEEGRPSAERRVREGLLLDAVATAEGISVSEEDVEARVCEMAEAQGMEPARLRNMALQQGWLGAIEIELRNERAFSLLASQAKIEEIEAGEEESDQG